MILTQPLNIVGVGSPQGDDSAAWEVIARLDQRLSGYRDVTLHTLDSGQRLLDLLDGEGRWVIIDALFPHGSPGLIHRLCWPTDQLECMRSFSSHGINLAEALHLAEALDVLPNHLILYGIEVERVSPLGPLSESVNRAVLELVEKIVQEYHLDE